MCVWMQIQGSRVRSRSGPILSRRLIMKWFLRSFSSLPLIHSRRVVVSYKRKYVHDYWLTACSSLPRKSVVRWTDRPAMTIAVDLGRKATKLTNNKITYLGACTKGSKVCLPSLICPFSSSFANTFWSHWIPSYSAQIHMETPKGWETVLFTKIVSTTNYDKKPRKIFSDTKMPMTSCHDL